MSEDATVRDLEERLAEALKREAEALRQLQTRDRELVEAQEQQTATAEILRIISSSPADVQPVLEAVAENAARLCESFDSSIFRRDGDRLLLVAHHGPIPFGRVGEFAIPLTRGSLVGRSIIEQRAVQVTDLQTETEEFPLGAATACQFGYRTSLAVPLLRESAEIGAISIRRTEVRPFTERQVALLKTFADQAVIAIENVRLFKELGERNAELAETLARQTATGEVLRAISRAQTDAQPVFDIIAESAQRLCGAGYGQVALYDGELLHMTAFHNISLEGVEALRRRFPARADRGSAMGRAIQTRTVVQIPDVLEDPGFAFKSELTTMGSRSILAAPMLRDGEPIGAIGVGRPEPGPFPDTQIALLKTFADQAVIAIENVRLFKELEARNRDLTATSEILRVISSSPTDVQPVFEAIVRSAQHLLNGVTAMMTRLVGDEVHLAAITSAIEAVRARIETFFPRPLAGTGHLEHVVRHRIPYAITDTETDPTILPLTRENARAMGVRSLLLIPMLRYEAVIGTIHVSRREPGGFSDDEVALLKTFADQAVIAIENVRLFNESKEALEQQTATSEILRVISRSPTDVQPVFDTIAESAKRLCNGDFAGVFRFDGTSIIPVALLEMSPEAREEYARSFPRPLGTDTLSGRAILARAVIHVPDVEHDPEVSPSSRQRARIRGRRSTVVVPMLRDGEPVGTINVSRREPRP